MPRIKAYGHLANKIKEREVRGVTVREAIYEALASSEDVKSLIINDRGQLNEFVRIYVNGKDIRALSGLDTAVDGNDTILILPAVAGG